MRENNNEMRNNGRKILFGIIAIVIMAGIVFSATYAFFTANITGNNNTETIRLEAGTLMIVYENGNSIDMEEIFPRLDSWDTKHFTVTGNNNTDVLMPYFINLHVTHNGFTDNAIEYTLSGTNTGGSGTLANDLTFHQGIPQGNGIYTLGQGQFVRGQSITHSYSLVFYFRDKGIEQNENQGKEIRGHISITGEAAGVNP